MKYSMTRSSLLAVLATILFCGVVAGVARGDEGNKKTIITFSEPVQVPGMVLPAGTYVFKLYDSLSDKNIVQIWTADGTKLITTILAIPNEKISPAGKTILNYEERPVDQPQALKAWFYPGDNRGQEFVYPKAVAMQLTEVNHYDVPSTGTEEAYTPPAPAPVVEQPAPQPVAAEPPAAAPAETMPAPAPQAEQPAVMPAKELPKTGSNAPLVALIGLLSLACFGVTRIANRRLS
jgi:LPXTG-motif cell wall-anchored protein